MKLQYFIVAMLCPLLSMCQTIPVDGRVVDEDGEAVAGATVRVVSGERRVVSRESLVVSDERGRFSIKEVRVGDSLVVSAVGFETKTELINERGKMTITLTRKITALDEAVVIGYGKTTRRLNTGSVGRVTAEQLEKQPVSNALAALSGRVPGVIISQRNGLPGGGITVQVRGQQSLLQGTEPLYIIDGMPYAPNNDPVSQLFSAAAPRAGEGLSAFAGIAMQDIESIEVLKDADATAIYGSRGANGVILITTKKGRAGKTQFNFTASTAVSKATRRPELLSTEEYLAMRREAFTNDGVIPTLTTAPDLLVWDSSRYTDFSKLVLGGRAMMQAIDGTVQGGSMLTQFAAGGGYLKEGTILPGGLYNSSGNFRLTVTHQLPGKRLLLQVHAAYSSSRNQLANNTMLSALSLPPNAPTLYDADGKLNWEEGGVSFSNPMAELLRRYVARVQQLYSSLLVNYRIAPWLHLKLSAGYTAVRNHETSVTPAASYNPDGGFTEASSAIGDRYFRNWQTEPQLELSKKLGAGRLTVLTGASLQESLSDHLRTDMTGFANDALLLSPAAASTLTASGGATYYRYRAVFARVNYRYRDKYILNLSGRRDGSSRFGPGRQYSNFGALGAAWIFTKESWMETAAGWLSFGKIRVSYGVTGNDQIGDHQYLDSWTSVSSYQDNPALAPTRLFNADYSWERNRKMEAAVELGFWQDRILVSAAYYRHRSDNQLLNYALPAMTGFTGILDNFPALLQNSGMELSASYETAKDKRIYYAVQASVTLHRNKLVSFPDLANSSYASSYVVGEPVNLIRNYLYLGVDEQTGVYRFSDINNDGVLNAGDYMVHGHLNPPLYGGLQQSLRMGNWQLDVFAEYRQQRGRNFASLLTGVPGTMVNQPRLVLGRWQGKGDAAIQQFTATASSDAYKAVALFQNSSGAYTDASFLRLKNFSLAYQLPNAVLNRLKLQSARLYVQAQNLFTLTGYEGADPEQMNLNSVPLLRTVCFGLQLNF